MTPSLLPPWEVRLLRLAGSAHSTSASPTTGELGLSAPLKAAYARCAAVSSAHSRSFHLASALLPAAKRRAIRALYALCRISDDLVDRQRSPRLFEAWRQAVLQPVAPAGEPVLLAWADTRRRYAIPQRYVEQLLDGVAHDLHPTPFATFDDLATYAYGVASTVGLMSMHIIGYHHPEAMPYAIKLGVALQLTNILRDVAEDWQAGRLYLPQAELDAIGLTRKDLATGQVTDRWRAFMAFQIERNRRLYREAWPGIRLLHRDGRLAVLAAADLYRAILGEIEANDYDVFHHRAHLSAVSKLRRLPGLWWQSLP